MRQAVLCRNSRIIWSEGSAKQRRAVLNYPVAVADPVAVVDAAAVASRQMSLADLFQ